MGNVSGLLVVKQNYEIMLRRCLVRRRFAWKWHTKCCQLRTFEVLQVLEVLEVPHLVFKGFSGSNGSRQKKHKTRGTDETHKTSVGGLVLLLLPVAQHGEETLSPVRYQVEVRVQKPKPQVAGDVPTMRPRRKAFF